MAQSTSAAEAAESELSFSKPPKIWHAPGAARMSVSTPSSTRLGRSTRSLATSYLGRSMVIRRDIGSSIFGNGSLEESGIVQRPHPRPEPYRSVPGVSEIAIH